MITPMAQSRLTHFGQFLDECIQRSSYGSPAAFAEAVETSAGFLSDLKHGMRKPPKKSLHVWAAKLRLEDNELHKFFALALLERTPRAIREVLRDYLDSADRGGTLEVEWKRMYIYYQRWGSS